MAITNLLGDGSKAEIGGDILVGLALGDAFGAPVEFEAPSAILPRRAWLETFPGGGPFGWAPGEFTDDTQMALVLAEHLLANGVVEQHALSGSFAQWAAAAADVGSQTRRVTSAVARGASWREAVDQLPPDAAGNGSLMRVAPVTLIASSRSQAMELAAAQSVVTHPNRLCVDACRVFTAALWDASIGQGVPLDAYAPLADEPAVADAVRRSAQATPPRMSGFVIDTLAGALWAVAGARNFSEAVWRAASLGRDADTVAAVAGALAAARFHGDAGIPVTWEHALVSHHPMFASWTAVQLRATGQALYQMRTEHADEA